MKHVLCTITLVFVLCLTAQAQQQKGDTELQLSGSILSIVGQDNLSLTTGLVTGKLGYFFTDRLEFGVTSSITISSTSFNNGFSNDRTTTVTFGGGAFATLALLANDATTVPYIGGQYFKQDFEDGEESGSAGVNGGIKFFLTRNAAFDFNGNYLFNLDNPDNALIFVQFGISFLL